MTPFRATYRLQLGGGFGFAAARELVPYLADLGVSHLYLPPSFQARPGSMHGYDVVDPTSISEELGGEAEFRALVDAAHEAGLGVILDIVPNHMAVDDANRYWTEQREKFFDFDTPASPAGTGASSTSTTWPACGRRIRRCSRRPTGWRSRSCARARSTGCGSTTRTGSRTRRATSSGCATPASSTCGWRRSSTRASGCARSWPVEGTVGYEFLNDAAALFVDPAGEERLTALWNELAGDDRGRSARTPTRPSWSRHRPPSPRKWNGCGASTTARRPREAALASLPVYRTYIRDAAGARGPRGPGARRGSSGCSTPRPSSSRASSRRRRR